MKVDEMELLLRVAETGSMSLAARQMHLTPAAVSAAVKRVEESLGVRVFERTGRLVRVLPTLMTGPVAIRAVFPSRQYMPARVRALDAALTAAFDARSRRCDAWLRGASTPDEA